MVLGFCGYDRSGTGNCVPRSVLSFPSMLIWLFWSTWTLQEFHNCLVYLLKGDLAGTASNLSVNLWHILTHLFLLHFLFSMIFLSSSYCLLLVYLGYYLEEDWRLFLRIFFFLKISNYVFFYFVCRSNLYFSFTLWRRGTFACHRMPEKVGEQLAVYSLLPPCGFWSLNSYHQAWWQAPLHI